LNQVLGSLVLGGYDTSKFIPNTVNWSFDAQDSVDISVNVDNIISTSSQKDMLTKPIKIYMDSSVPQIWLPIEVCRLFEAEFGIVWNDALKLYLVNQTQHDILIARNTSIVFVLSSLSSPGTVNITLPYAAFDLTLSAPLVANPPVRYFPLKRAENSTQYTLGRTFFQEAYLTADYERRNFSVSQCNWDPSAQSKIVPILSSSTTSTTDETTSSPNHPFKLSKGAIISIAVGGAGLLLVAGIIFYVFIVKRRQKRQNRSIRKGANLQGTEEYRKAELDGNNYPNESMKDKIQEMETIDNVQEMETPSVSPTTPISKFNTQIAEVDGISKFMTNREHVEADGREIQIYEMPAREEVAIEIGDNNYETHDQSLKH